MIDCPEAVRRMWAYLGHALEPAPSEEFEVHLETCKRCCGELEFSRHLREMVSHRAAPEKAPGTIRLRIEELLATGGAPPEGDA